MKRIRQAENWAKDNPIKLSLFSYLILELSIYFIDIFKGVDYSSFLSYVISFLQYVVSLLQIDFNVKTWHVLSIALIIAAFVFTRRKLRKSNSTSLNEEFKKIKSEEDQKIYLAKYPFNYSFNSNFLSNNTGTFSIWAHVSDMHYEIHSKSRYMCIVGYSTNPGGQLSDSFARYPNAWAIQRITPSANDKNGIWRFWCNNVDNKSTVLDYKEILTGGWHLFSVSWSQVDDYIKFIIDEKVVAQGRFLNWPSDFTSSVHLGTWGTRTFDHFFDAKIGPRRFAHLPYKENFIKDYFRKKPLD